MLVLYCNITSYIIVRYFTKIVLFFLYTNYFIKKHELFFYNPCFNTFAVFFAGCIPDVLFCLIQQQIASPYLQSGYFSQWLSI